jgi:saccharopine dehydrogenase-like NADP-dependent oxidoreductase
MTSNVIVLGGSGMLGSMVTDYLSRDNTLNVCATVRSKELADAYRQKINNVKWVLFDAAAPDLDKSLDVISGYEWVINAIGITKPLVHDNNAVEIGRAHV